MNAAELVAALMLAALAIYTCTGGADFGGGVFDLFASGPRREEQRKLIEHALAPVWEANHVWLIFIIVLMFTAFPEAFSQLSISFFVPLTLVLVGIVFRGAAFVLRQYGEPDAGMRRLLSVVFGGASTVTPVALGVILAGIVGGTSAPEASTGGAGGGGFGLFGLLVGAFVLALFSLIAAIYLTVEAESAELKQDFRRRALSAGVLLGVLAFGVTQSASGNTPRFSAALLDSWWSWPLQIFTGGVALAVLAAVATRRDRLARTLVILQASAIVLGFGLGQRPYLIAPNVTISSAAAPEATIRVLLVIASAGALLLIPSLYFLLRVFKTQRR